MNYKLLIFLSLLLTVIKTTAKPLSTELSMELRSDQSIVNQNFLNQSPKKHNHRIELENEWLINENTSFLTTLTSQVISDDNALFIERAALKRKNLVSGLSLKVGIFDYDFGFFEDRYKKLYVKPYLYKKVLQDEWSFNTGLSLTYNYNNFFATLSQFTGLSSYYNKYKTSSFTTPTTLSIGYQNEFLLTKLEHLQMTNDSHKKILTGLSANLTSYASSFYFDLSAELWKSTESTISVLNIQTTSLTLLPKVSYKDLSLGILFDRARTDYVNGVNSSASPVNFTQSFLINYSIFKELSVEFEDSKSFNDNSESSTINNQSLKLLIQFSV